MITIPSLSDVTDILDTDQVIVTNAQGQSYKIAGSELNKRHKVIIADSTTVTGAPLKTGNCVRIYFTADITANNTTTVLQINYNNVNYYVKVPKNGALENFVAFNLGGSPAVYKYVQAYTTLELLFDGTQFIIMCNPVVISGTNFTIFADGLKRVDEVTENGTDLVTSHAVASAIDKVKDIMAALPTDAVLHYSFDDVPDLPDGTANYRPDFYTTDGGWTTDNYCAFSHSDGILKMQCTGNANEWRSFQNFTDIANKIIMMKVKPNFDNASFRLSSYDGSSYTNIFFQSIPKGKWTSIIGKVPSTHISYIRMNSGQSSDTTRYFEIKDFYIGDGSYSTPIIDNANGHNNATNNGGIAVQGVSGKGLFFVEGAKKRILTSSEVFKNSDSWTISFWLNLNEGSVATGKNPRLYSFGNIEYCFINNLYKGYEGLRNFSFYTYIDETHRLQIGLYNVNSLLGKTIHIAVETTINTSGVSTKKIFCNGEKVGEVSNSSITTRPNVNSYGSIFGTGSANEFVENSMLDDFLIFDRALTDTEVMALYLNKANTPKYYPPAQLPS